MKKQADTPPKLRQQASNRELLRIEGQRRIEEYQRNEQRFFDYNARRVSAGLQPLSHCEFLARRFRDVKPQHRDNIDLQTR